MTSETPEEWEKITDGLGTEQEPYWWYKENSNAISHDGGKTYYLLNDPMGADGKLPVYETALRPVPPAHYPKDLSQAVYQAVGAGSTCWESMEGTGVFDEARARETAEDLITWVNEHYTPKENVNG